MKILKDEKFEPFTGAIQYENGSKFWYLNGKRHRTDGPAVEHVNGDKSWYYHNQRIYVNSQEEFETWLVLKAFE